jgi:hypothetical protein
MNLQILLYLEYLVCGVYCTQWELMIVPCRDEEGWLQFIFVPNGSVEPKEETYERW